MKLFNLIIPTRERNETLIHCISSVVKTNYENCKFIVSDNYGSGNTKEIVESFKDKRLQYIRTPQRLSMAGNYEYALSHCKDGWISILGDDDGILPHTIQNMMQLAEFYNVDAISSNMLHFQWGTPSNKQPGKFLIPKNEKDEIRNSKQLLEEILKGKSKFGSDYSQLPWLYHGGAAKKSLIDMCINPRTQKFFNGTVPDVYSAVAIGRKVDRYLRIGEPSVVSGTSKFSIGTSQMKIMAVQSVEDPFQQFLREADIKFSKNLILGKSLMAIIYDCFEKSDFLDQLDANIPIDEMVRIMIKLSGKNILTILKESKNTLELNKITSLSPYAFGVKDWLNHNLDKHLILKKNYKKKALVTPEIYNIFDAVNYVKNNTQTTQIGQYLL
ncbi:MAG: glycosyltransferase family 2 protein [Amylibacter sp.]